MESRASAWVLVAGDDSSMDFAKTARNWGARAAQEVHPPSPAKERERRADKNTASCSRFKSCQLVRSMVRFSLYLFATLGVAVTVKPPQAGTESLRLCLKSERGGV